MVYFELFVEFFDELGIGFEFFVVVDVGYLV